MTFKLTDEQEAFCAGVMTGEDVLGRALAGSGKTTLLAEVAKRNQRRRMTYIAFNRALRNDQPVLTPTGWREIGTLAVGEVVFGVDGLPHVITKVHPRGVQNLFEVVFSDGTVVVADGDHLWATQTIDYDKKFDRWVVRDTHEIRRLVTTTGRKVRVPHLSAPVQFPEQELPLDPYLLGALLGDDSFRARAVLFCCAEPKLVDQVRSTLPLRHDINKINGSENSYSITGPRGVGRGCNVVMNALRELDLHGHGSQTKFVPRQYLFASVDQRLALLQGLMDTDGCASGPVSIFITTSKQLVEDVVFLAQSLGGVATFRSYPAGDEHIQDGRVIRRALEAYQVNVRLAVPLCPFRLPRKVAGWRVRGRDVQTARKIVDVRPVGVGEATCISVAAEDHLFLTAGCVPTHNSIADEAKRRFPSNTLAKTIHSFAFASVGRRFEHRLNGPRIEAWKVADILGLPERFEFGAFSLRSYQLARLVMDSVKRFCHSAADSPSPGNLSKVSGLTSPEARRALEQMLMPFVVRAWEDLTSLNGQLRFDHDTYLKIWALTHPRLPGDVILADEVQDFNPVVKQIIDDQVGTQKLYVGDEFQQLYEWRGSVNAIASIEALTFPLTKTFRFGPMIANEANRILELLGTDLRVEGHEPVGSRLAYLSDPDCVLTRTNAEAIARLMAAQVAGVRAGLVGGTSQVEALAKAALDLTEGRKTSHHELIAFESWSQVRAYADEDPDAVEIKMLVRLVDRHGAQVLLDAIRRAVPEVSADLVISTTHKAKGREWSRVALAGDFEPLDEETRQWSDSELRLTYVAATRAIDYLDPSRWGWLTELAANEQDRVFLAEEDVPARPEPVAPKFSAPTAQLVCDPEDATRLMFCRTPYNSGLVAGQQKLSRQRFFGEYAGETKVRVALATPQAIALAEEFCLTISDEARSRVEELFPQ